MSGVATLIADGGEPAAEKDFFRSTEFLAAEGVTHTLRIAIDGRTLLTPLKVESVDGGLAKDATSPYGYPGLSGTEGATIDPDAVDFTGTGLVAIFLRHRLDEVPLLGATERNPVYIADPSEPRKSRPQDRRQVKRNVERGYRTEILPGPDTSQEERAAFAEVYKQTMVRNGAKAKYFYSDAYFDLILGSDQTQLVVTRDREGAVAAASIAVFSDGFIHYYLTGASDSHRRQSPTKNIVTALIDRSYETGVPVNLGGGMAERDTLSMFKRGFANRKLRLHTSEVVCDADGYARLTGTNPSGDYFPAYRSPAS